jgi:uncharacterized protein (TIGR03435 family)
MLMIMLIDRLHLKFHSEKRDMQMLALTVGKDGPKLTPHHAKNGGALGSTRLKPLFAHFKDEGDLRLHRLLCVSAIPVNG